jgi:hypothetical protein
MKKTTKAPKTAKTTAATTTAEGLTDKATVPIVAPVAATTVIATAPVAELVIEKKEIPIMDAAAWAKYNQPNIFEGIAMRRYLPISELYDIVSVLRCHRGEEYVLTWEDLTVLVYFDGDGQTAVECPACKKQFKPVVWPIVNAEYLRKLDKANGDLTKVESQGGAWFLFGGKVLPFCGAVRRYRKEGDREVLFPDSMSCAGIACQDSANKNVGGGVFIPRKFSVADEIQAVRDEVARHEHEREIADRQRGLLTSVGQVIAAATGKAKAKPHQRA